MAIAYETGVASSPTDLLNKLKTFSAANGWGNSSPLDVGNLLNDTVLSNGASGLGIFCAINATATQWQTRGCLGFSGAVSWSNQPHNSGFTMSTTFGAGPYTAYHFWVGDEGGSEYIHVTVEIVAGEFRHWVCGHLIEFGGVTGGNYFDSAECYRVVGIMNSPEDGTHRHLCDSMVYQGSSGVGAHVWADYDSRVKNWFFLENNSNPAIQALRGIGSTRRSGILNPMISIGVQNWNLRTPLWPMIYYANRGVGLRSPVGRMPNIRSCNMRNFFPGEVITIGGDDWKIFPVFQKQIAGVANNVVSSGLYAYAHLMP